MPTPAEFSIEGKVFVAVGAGARHRPRASSKCSPRRARTGPSSLSPPPTSGRWPSASGTRPAAASTGSPRTGPAPPPGAGGGAGAARLWPDRHLGQRPRRLDPLPDSCRSPSRTAGRRRASRCRTTTCGACSTSTSPRWSPAAGRPPYFVARGRGCVINVGSFAGRRGAPTSASTPRRRRGVEGAHPRAGAGVGAPRHRRQLHQSGLLPRAGDAGGQTGLRAGPRGVPLGRFGRPREVGLLALYLGQRPAPT